MIRTIATRRHSIRRASLMPLIATFVLSACGFGGSAGFDGSPRPSAEGQFVASATSTPSPPPVNEMHTWTLHLERADGTPIEQATITVDGDMPAHGHGLPTEPRATRYVGDGDYLVEGMLFQMGGEWYVEFSVVAGGVEDAVRFEFEL